MREVGILEAKTNLSTLVSEVESEGVSFAITRHGRRIARLTPDSDAPASGPRRKWTHESWARFLDEVWARQDAEARANPKLLEPYDLRADRDAIE